jgi:hypothetical protein
LSAMWANIAALPCPTDNVTHFVPTRALNE